MCTEGRGALPLSDGRVACLVSRSNDPVRTLGKAVPDALRFLALGFAMSGAASARSHNSQALGSQLANRDCNNSKAWVTVKHARQATARFRIKEGHCAAISRIGEASARRAAPL
jgi:hypothetical protein